MEIKICNREKVKISLGFTLLEVMVSFSIFSIAVLGLSKAYSNQMTFNTLTERKSSALAAGQMVLDRLRTIDPTALPSTGTTTESVTISPRTFSVVVRYCPSGSTYCTSQNIKELTVEVSYRGVLQSKFTTIYSQLR
jgi:prepilin-type N-terminal cleavage/methylation domain-containing protein